MKKIRINQGTIGLIFKKGDYDRVLTQGTHWLKFGESLENYDLTRPFYPNRDLSFFSQDTALMKLLTIVEVKDNEIVLRYENNNFKEVLSAGKHAFWNGFIKHSFERVDLSKAEITENIHPSIFQRSELSSYIRICKIEPYEQGILFIDNKAVKTLSAGDYFFWKNGQSVLISKADMRQRQLEISGQEILTKDKAALRVNFFVQFKVKDIEKALIENKEYEKQLYILIQLGLREYIGKWTLDEMLENKEAVEPYIMAFLKVKADALGVKLIHCGMRDVILPGEMKDIMNQVLIAQKQAQANVITRREETASTRSLLNTAKLMEDNDMLFKLKEMEYVEKIADKIGEITVSGNGQVVDQLKSIFSAKR